MYVLCSVLYIYIFINTVFWFVELFTINYSIYNKFGQNVKRGAFFFVNLPLENTFNVTINDSNKQITFTWLFKRFSPETRSIFCSDFG